MDDQPVLVRKAILPTSQEIDRMVQVLRTALRGDMHVAAMTTGHPNLESQFFVSQVRQGLTYGEVYVAGSNGRIDGVLIAFGPSTNKLTSDTEYVSQLSREMQEWWYQHMVPKYDELVIAALGSKDVFKAAWQITMLAIHPDQQRKGIARQLMETVMTRAQAQGQMLCLSVWNDQQVRFCSHFGFTSRSTKNVSSYQGGFPLFFMTKGIPPVV